MEGNTKEKKQKNDLIGTKRGELIGSLFVVLAAVLFGFMPMMTKISYAHGCNSYSTAFYRFFFGSLILGLYNVVMPGHSLRVERKHYKSILFLSVLYAAMPIMLYESYHFIDTGLATTLHFTYPASVVVLMAVFFKKRPDIRQLVCVILCVAGILLAGVTGDVSGQIEGVLLTVISGVIYSLYIIYLGQSEIKTLPTLTLSFWISLLSAVEIGAVALITGELRFDLDGIGWGAVIFLGLSTTAIALSLFQRGVLLCGEVKSALLSTFEPLVGLAVGILVFHEKLVGQKLVGAVLILLSIIILVLPEKAQKE